MGDTRVGDENRELIDIFEVEQGETDQWPIKIKSRKWKSGTCGNGVEKIYEWDIGTI